METLFKTVLVGIFGVSSLSIVGCRTTGDKTDLKITGGELTDELPAVVQLTTRDALCTGTFVSKTTLLTAAHCVKVRADGTPYVATTVNTGRGTPQVITSKLVFHHGKELAAWSADTLYQDFVVVLFGQPIAPAYVPINLNTIANAAKPSDIRVTIIGFGMERNDPATAEKKRMAQTRVAELVSNKSIHLSGIPITNPGDSGSPLLVNSEIVGILSSGAYDEQNPSESGSSFVNISHQENVDLMRKAIAAGAEIAGFPGSLQATTGEEEPPVHDPNKNPGTGLKVLRCWDEKAQTVFSFEGSTMGKSGRVTIHNKAGEVPLPHGEQTYNYRIEAVEGRLKIFIESPEPTKFAVPEEDKRIFNPYIFRHAPCRLLDLAQ